ncbi:hypothetical protein BD414DRAFT_115331 [Trametes punicea]|nr:hypothetical protein BD414DRAFT_115331 [Trametes punicea]
MQHRHKFSVCALPVCLLSYSVVFPPVSSAHATVLALFCLIAVAPSFLFRTMLTRTCLFSATI